MSVLKKRRGNRVVEHHTAILRGGNGADDETARRVIESDGQEDHVVGGRRDHWGDRPDHEAMAGTIGLRRLFRPGGPAQGQAQRPAGSDRDGGGGAAALPGGLLRPEHAALPGEAARGAWHPFELHVGAEGAPGSRLGGARTKTAQASEGERTAAHAWERA